MMKVTKKMGGRIAPSAHLEPTHLRTYGPADLSRRSLK
jgi:hypothetical protein